MSFLSDLLGGQYRPDMTHDELDTAIAKAVNNMKSESARYKAAMEKANSEAANYKNQLRGFQTEQEKAANDAKEALEKAEKENAELKRSIALAGRTNELLTQGYTQELAVSTATALVDGDIDTVLKNQKEYAALVEQKAQEKLIGGTPYPVVGTGSGMMDYGKLIEQAIDEGDDLKATYYTRLQAEAEASRK